jgi:hypothetical protein
MEARMNQDKLMGLESPGDQKIPVQARTWDATRRALWRSKVAWDIALREANAILARCRHVEDCPAQSDETAVCQMPQPASKKPRRAATNGCPDRELRLSMLVILNAAREFAPLNASRLAEGPYFAPSREHFSNVIAELAACQAELAAINSEFEGSIVEIKNSTDSSTLG